MTRPTSPTWTRPDYTGPRYWQPTCGCPTDAEIDAEIAAAHEANTRGNRP